MNLSTVNVKKLSNHTNVAVQWILKNEIIPILILLSWLYHVQIWHVYTACVSQFYKLVTSDVGHIADDEQDIMTERQTFMKLSFFYYFDSFFNSIHSDILDYIY
jgi:hypothetical protein